jgi:hypothetical protein
VKDERDALLGLETESAQTVPRAVDLARQLGVGDRPPLEADRRSVAAARREMRVDQRGREVEAVRGR